MRYIRQLVCECAEELDEIEVLEETLKWGEPSYLTKYGSTLRMDWKEKSPDQYALYFMGTSRLVEIFKLLNSDKLNFEGSRAIVFKLEDEIPVIEVKECIKSALRYQKVKKLSTLGI